MQTIKIKRDDEVVTVAKADYIKAKSRQLKEFGYPHATEQLVEEQLDKVLAGAKKMADGLTIIGMFIEGDIENRKGGLYFTTGEGLQVRIIDDHLDRMKAYEGKTVQMGIRPENLHDKLYASNATPDNTATGRVEVVQPLGGQCHTSTGEVPDGPDNGLGVLFGHQVEVVEPEGVRSRVVLGSGKVRGVRDHDAALCQHVAHRLPIEDRARGPSVRRTTVSPARATVECGGVWIVLGRAAVAAQHYQRGEPLRQPHRRQGGFGKEGLLLVGHSRPLGFGFDLSRGRGSDHRGQTSTCPSKPGRSEGLRHEERSSHESARFGQHERCDAVRPDLLEGIPTLRLDLLAGDTSQGSVFLSAGGTLVHIHGRGQ